MAAPRAKKALVKDVTFKGSEGAGQIALAIDGDPEIHLGEVTATHVELIVDGAELGPKLERTLDVSRFGSPIKQVSSFRDRRSPDRVRLIAELVQPATPTLERDAAGAHLAFSTDKHVARTTNVPSPIVGGFGAAS